MLKKLIGLGFVALTSLNSVLTVDSGSEVSPACKVNKNLISVYSCNEPGEVAVVGQPGSITTTSSVVVYVNNLISGARVDITPGQDMSFSTSIKANPGDKLRVNAQNIQGKKSYGTFNVTANLPSQPQQTVAINDNTIPAVMEYNLPASQTPLNEVENQQLYQGQIEFNQDTQEGTNIAVVIMVVNTDTGQVLTTNQITGKSKTYAEKSPKNFAIMIDRIVDRCENIIKSEILRPDLERVPLDSQQN